MWTNILVAMLCLCSAIASQKSEVMRSTRRALELSPDGEVKVSMRSAITSEEQVIEIAQSGPTGISSEGYAKVSMHKGSTLARRDTRAKKKRNNKGGKHFGNQGPEGQRSIEEPIFGCKGPDDCSASIDDAKAPVCCKPMQGTGGGTASMSGGAEQQFPAPAQCKKECDEGENEVDGMERDVENEVDGTGPGSIDGPDVGGNQGPEGQRSIEEPNFGCKGPDGCSADAPMCCKPMRGTGGGTASMSGGAEQRFPAPAQCKKECDEGENEVDGMERDVENEVDGTWPGSIDGPDVGGNIDNHVDDNNNPSNTGP